MRTIEERVEGEADSHSSQARGTPVEVARRNTSGVDLKGERSGTRRSCRVENVSAALLLEQTPARNSREDQARLDNVALLHGKADTAEEDLVTPPN
jgi:hypothetical protein